MTDQDYKETATIEIVEKYADNAFNSSTKFTMECFKKLNTIHKIQFYWMLAITIVVVLAWLRK